MNIYSLDVLENSNQKESFVFFFRLYWFLMKHENPLKKNCIFYALLHTQFFTTLLPSHFSGSSFMIMTLYNLTVLLQNCWKRMTTTIGSNQRISTFQPSNVTVCWNHVVLSFALKICPVFSRPCFGPPALFCTKAILSAFSCLILAFEKASPSYAVSVVYTLIACYCVLFFNDDPFMSLSLPMTMTFLVRWPFI